jgi:hypothetical protein
VVVAVDLVALSQVRGEERPRLHVDGMARVGRTLYPLERCRDQGPPLVPLGTGMIRTTLRELLEVSVKRPTESDVQDLAAPAHAQDGELVLDREQRVGDVDLIEVGLPGQMLRMRVLTAVSPGLDVASAGQDQTVDPLYQVDPILLPFVIREEDGEGARCEQRAPVPVSVVVAVVGEALRDRDQRAADQVRTPTVVSNQASNIRLP